MSDKKRILQRKVNRQRKVTFEKSGGEGGIGGDEEEGVWRRRGNGFLLQFSFFPNSQFISILPLTL